MMRLRLERFREPSLTVLVVLQVLSVFVAQPLAAAGVLPVGVEYALNGAFVVVVLALASTNRNAQAIILAAALADVVSWLVHRGQPSPATLTVDFAARIIFLATVSAVLLYMVFTDEHEGTYHRILGGVAIYLNIAVIFAMLYRIATLYEPHAFSVSGPATENLNQYLYFSFETLTTTGYGDIVPVNLLVRSAANLESVLGALFPATLLARLVIRYFS